MPSTRQPAALEGHIRRGAFFGQAERRGVCFPPHARHIRWRTAAIQPSSGENLIILKLTLVGQVKGVLAHACDLQLIYAAILIPSHFSHA